MRIVQLVETLNVGGLERVALDLALQQQAVGHSPILYCIFSKGPFADVAAANGIPVRCFGKIPGFSIKTLAALTSALKQDAPDVVHTHQQGIHHYAAVAARLAGVAAVVSTIHSPSATLLRPYQHRYFRWVLPLTSNVAVVSQATLDFLVAHRLPRRKLRVIWNGVPVQKYRSKMASPGSRRPVIRFGTIGRFVPEKDHATLLEAFKRVLARVPEAELSIVGYGALHAALCNQVNRLGLGNHVRLEGRTNDVAGILSDLDVFVLSSVTEGLPVVVLEAMATGLPIVSTRVGGISEVAPEGKVAWYCEPGAAGPLAEAMFLAATSPHLHEMGFTASQLALANFDISVMQKNYEAMYRDSMRWRRP
jgi:glycosyltransferase involved in cell wall biosynthesis